MKRIGNVYSKICDYQNIVIADKKARKGKSKQACIKKFDLNYQDNIQALQKELIDGCYKTSEYYIFSVFEPKQREIYRLPYRDRIVQHAILNLLEEPLVSMFTSDTYSCIKKRGIHAALKALKKALNDVASTQYSLKLDIKKFYPSVDHDILKKQLGRKIKDVRLLSLLHGIIDSADGLPIGNYLSQYLSNFYLTGFDHWIKEVKKVKYYFRYADDMVILCDNKHDLHELLDDIKAYLSDKLNLIVKSNHQIFPVAARGIDFVGYVFYHTHIRVRKSIKKRYARMISRKRTHASVMSYHGWFKHGDCKNLIKKIEYESIQRFKYSRRAKRLYRRKNKSKENIE